MLVDSPCRDESIHVFNLSYVGTILFSNLLIESTFFARPGIEPAP